MAAPGGSSGSSANQLSSVEMAEEPLGLWGSINAAYQVLVDAVIRPQRVEYFEEDLGPKTIKVGDIVLEREDITLVNKRQLQLECSWWRPKLVHDKCNRSMPVAIILHGNSSCRLAAVEVLFNLIAAGFSVFGIDCSGSGQSEGDYVSLGWFESQDAETAIDYLNSTSRVSSIVLWGRSMGAVAALFCASRRTEVKAMVLDCPFAKFSQLAKEMVEGGKLGVPKFLVNVALRMVRRTIKRKADFDVFDLKPIDIVDRIYVPTIYGVAIEDEVIGPHHGKELFDRHAGPKEFVSFHGGHNSARPASFYSKATHFLQGHAANNSPSFLPKQMEAFVSNIKDEDLFPATLPSSPSAGHDRNKCTQEGTSPYRQGPRNPFVTGQNVDSVNAMSVKDLKDCLARAGVDSSRCIEKSDLVDLVRRSFEEYQRRALAM